MTEVDACIGIINMTGKIACSRSDGLTSRKHAKGPPQKYQNEDEPVPMLVLVPVLLGWMGPMDEP